MELILGFQELRFFWEYMRCFLTIEFLLRDEGLDDSLIDLRN
jgi:hypothetical protein